MASLLIGEVATRTGVAVATIRYYESIGLLAPPERSAAGYRRYTERAIDEIAFIRKAQRLGFSLEEIGAILRLGRAGATPCSLVLDLARAHLTEVDERIRQLVRFRDRLAAELARWDGEREPTCDGFCRVILDLDVDAREAVRPPLPVAPRNRRENREIDAARRTIRRRGRGL
jgi:MerR family copper efflux transcriptional regulator